MEKITTIKQFSDALKDLCAELSINEKYRVATVDITTDYTGGAKALYKVYVSDYGHNEGSSPEMALDALRLNVFKQNQHMVIVEDDQPELPFSQETPLGEEIDGGNEIDEGDDMAYPDRTPFD